MEGIDIIFSLIILVMSVVIHEVSHGYMAAILGDPTARLAGRLTLNPIKHLDPIGSVLVPIVTSLSGFTFGWAKPVPYNPYNLRNQRWGELMVAAAGPASNITIAIVLGLVLRFASPDFGFGTAFGSLLASAVLVNIVLAVFNLVPITPLDGSKVLFAFLPYHLLYIREWLERYSLILLLVFIFFLWGWISPVVILLFRLITGIPV